jgi:hypothetical protein
LQQAGEAFIVEIMKRLLIIILISSSAHADVYKSINAAGEVFYSDTPTQGAEVLEMPELPTYTPPAVTESAPATDEPAATAVYSELVFVKPEDDATIRNNQGIINAELALAPALRTRSNHRIQFYLDGEPHGKPGTSIRTTMANVDRGEHSLSASVLDSSGEAVISSDPVIVHLHRETINNPNNPNNPNNRPRPTPLAN